MRTPGSIRVAAIIPGDDFSGPAGQVASTAEALASVGVELRFVLLCRPGAATGRLPAFLDRRSVEYAIIDDHGPLDVGVVKRIAHLFRSWDPQIVETHGYKATAAAYLLRLLGSGWRWVGFFHGATTESRRARFYHWLDHRMLGRADVAVAITSEQRALLARRARAARVVYSAVTALDPPRDAAGQVLPALEQSDRPRLGVVGRLSPEKGVDVFLRALGLLAARNVGFTASIAGDGPERAELEALTRTLGLVDRVTFLGRVSAMGAYYALIDVLVIPSRSEGLPSVLLEALNADVAVVATSVGAIPEVLTSADAGWLVRPEHPEALADAIESTIASRDSAAARQAREAVAKRFSQEQRADALLTIYRELTDPTA